MTDNFIDAPMYDKMINWESRLAREIPVISSYFADLGNDAVIFDVACSSGRHSLALNKEGFQTVGVDISPEFIEFAKQLSQEQGTADKASFVEINAADKELIRYFKGRYFDGAILLGNAIANMGNFAQGQQLIRNIFALLRPGAKFFVQTVNKPHKPWYNPLRGKDGIIIQRIMIPEPIYPGAEHEHNVVLAVNQIDSEKLEYLDQKADNLFFMFRLDEFKQLMEQTGFVVNNVFSGYHKAAVEDIDGETLIWELQKPEIELFSEGEALFATYTGMTPAEVKAATLEIWQDLVMEHWYHCIRGFRFLYPRITAHPRYAEFVEASKEGPVLDIACFVGTDLRQLYVDGVRQLHGMDISEVFIEAGKQLFEKNMKEGLQSAEIEFSVGDITAANFLDQQDTTATGEFARYYQFFKGIHAGSLLHLLDEEQVVLAVSRAYAMLQSDGIFFGRAVGSETAGYINNSFRYLHSVETLRSVFNSVGFSEVDVVIMPVSGPKGESSTSTSLQLGFFAKK